MWVYYNFIWLFYFILYVSVEEKKNNNEYIFISFCLLQSITSGILFFHIFLTLLKKNSLYNMYIVKSNLILNSRQNALTLRMIASPTVLVVRGDACPAQISTVSRFALPAANQNPIYIFFFLFTHISLLTSFLRV
jgi:hypothetical protein